MTYITCPYCGGGMPGRPCTCGTSAAPSTGGWVFVPEVELPPVNGGSGAELTARIATLEAERDRLREALADAVGALDAAGAELSEFASILSREPREANLTYQSARDAQDALARAALEAGHDRAP